MDKATFFKNILDTYNKYGYINRKLLIEEFPDYNVGWQLSKYHGLKNICSELGLNYRQASMLNPKDIEDDFIEVYRKHGTISEEIYNKYGTYSSSVIKTHFGGINSLMKKLDIPLNTSRLDTQEDVIRDFVNFYDQYHSTSSTKYRKYGKYSQSVIDRLFGSWNDFMNELGMKSVGNKPGASKMIDDVLELFNKYGFLSAKLINDNCDFTYQALSYYYSMDEISDFCGVDNAFVKFRSSGSKVLEKILVDIFSKENVVCEYSEKWLINPQTKKRMYVDFFIKSINTAIEFDGKQHYEFIEFIHRNYKNFFWQVYRDRVKEKILLKHGIKTIRFKYDENLSNEYVRNKLFSI